MIYMQLLAAPLTRESVSYDTQWLVHDARTPRQARVFHHARIITARDFNSYINNTRMLHYEQGNGNDQYFLSSHMLLSTIQDTNKRQWGAPPITVIVVWSIAHKKIEAESFNYLRGMNNKHVAGWAWA